MTAVSEEVVTAEWWAMEIPCESSEQCGPDAAAPRYVFLSCRHVQPLCEKHTKRAQRLDAERINRWCHVCGRLARVPHETTWRPL